MNNYIKLLGRTILFSITMNQITAHENKESQLSPLVTNFFNNQAFSDCESTPYPAKTQCVDERYNFYTQNFLRHVAEKEEEQRQALAQQKHSMFFALSCS